MSIFSFPFTVHGWEGPGYILYITSDQTVVVNRKCVSFPFSIFRLTLPASRAFPFTSCTPNPDRLCGLHWIHCSLSMSFLQWPETDTTLSAVLQNSAGPNSFTSPRKVWMQLALFAARSHCWFMCSLLLTRTLTSFSAEFLCWQSALACIVPWGYSIKKQGWVFSCGISQGSCRSCLQVPLKNSLSLLFGFIHKSDYRRHHLSILVMDKDMK